MPNPTELKTVLDDGPVPSGFCDLFNSPEFFKHTTPANGCYFKLMDGTRLAGVAHFSEIEAGTFRSPARGTYGGLQLSEYDYEAYVKFLADIEAELKTRGARKAVIVGRPFAHDLRHSTLFSVALRSAGYRVELSDINYTIAVDDTPLTEKAHHSVRKRVRKCLEHGLAVRRTDSVAEAEALYNVIVENRRSKGYPVSMTFEDLRASAEAFPGRYIFFGVYDGNTPVAASVSVAVSPIVLYVFYWGDLPGQETLSPVTLLATEIYSYCREKGIQLLDIGTVGVNGVPSTGLMKFKASLGFEESLKLTYSKELA